MGLLMSPEMTHQFSPKTLLKSRRPEKFSDTVVQAVPELHRTLFEYHLDSLTSRSQENDFERFARRLCEAEICPNLLPHTGPTGGGDSKVDAETYPVAESLALSWFVGVGGREAAMERWGFAFSAKRDWRPKVRSDVAKLVATGRGYSKAFFVSSRFIPDRERAEVEDKLRIEHGVDVRIFDRTWILDRVFEHHRESLAVEELSVDLPVRQHVVKGPRDQAREEALAESEEMIETLLREQRTGSALVEHALDAADIARQLERPRIDLQGRYARADELAMRFGSQRQQVEAAYQWAWTLLWWLEDEEALFCQYARVEERAIASDNVQDLECLTNLLQLIYASVRQRQVAGDIEALNGFTSRLTASLERLSVTKERPSAALQAKTMLAQVAILQKMVERKPIDAELGILRDCFARTEGLVGFPLQSIVEVVTELGRYVDECPAYESLMDTITEIVAARTGEISAGRLYLHRGEQKIRAEREVEAIALLGRSFAKLGKNETRRELVYALYLCARAYENIGLLWAARGTLLSAASISTSDYWRYGDVTPHQATCYRRLKWIELKLGRVAHSLVWFELEKILWLHLKELGEDVPSDEDSVAYGGLLAGLLLRSQPGEFQLLETLPDALERLGLSVAAETLLFALGYPEHVESGAAAVGMQPLELMSRLFELDSEGAIPRAPEFYASDAVRLVSNVLGCRVSVQSRTASPCIEVSEAILAALEGFVATSAAKGAMAFRESFEVEVVDSETQADDFVWSMRDVGSDQILSVSCRRSPDVDTTGGIELSAASELILAVVSQVLAQSVHFSSLSQDLGVLIKDERVLDRAIGFASAFGAQANVLGRTPKTSLAAWSRGNDRRYAKIPTKAWSPPKPSGEVATKPIRQFRPGEGDAPPALLDRSNLSPAQVHTSSVINVPVWDQAKWNAVLFMYDPTMSTPPCLGLVFREGEAGHKIFAEWRNRFGDVDRDERFRISIVKGVCSARVHDYTVVIGSEIPSDSGEDGYWTMVSRMCRMGPSNSTNLDNFVRCYRGTGAFFLFPAFTPKGWDGSTSPEYDMRVRLLVRRLHIREAWEIGPNDPDGIAIDEDDDPIVPTGVTNPPVRWWMERRAKGSRKGC
jgi:tetratricopeptide (TPR) repeat protein